MKNFMVKVNLWVLSTVLITGFLIGCAQEKNHPFESSDSCVEKESSVYSEVGIDDAEKNEDFDYQIIEIEGNTYFSFDDESRYKDLSTSQMAPVVSFKSMRAFYEGMNCGTLTEEQKKIVAKFDRNEAGQIQICNTNNLVTPIVPEDVQIRSIDWYGKYYSAMIGGDVYGYITPCDKATYNKRAEEVSITQNERITITSVEFDEDRNAEVTNYNTKNARLKQIRYTVQSGDRQIVVIEKYNLEVLNPSVEGMLEISDTVPASIQLFCIEDGRYSYGWLTSFEERPTVEWLKDWGLSGFVYQESEDK